MRFSGLLAHAAFVLIAMTWTAHAADGPARRAFVIGIERYADDDIQGLNRADTDAKDLGKDLEQVGFDPKAITVATDIKNKADFNTKFDTFLKTVNEGDFVFFFFSGHGLGVESTNTNYLLLGDVKSPTTYTRAQLAPADRKDSSVVRARVNDYLDSYETNEIPRAGISVTEIQNRIAEKKPATAFLILDACRTMIRSEAVEGRVLRRGASSGSRLVPDNRLPAGFLVLYSAAFGEQAVESFDGNDRRRNSLFTEVLRSEMVRPGQSLVDLSQRVRLVVNALAGKGGRQQEPEFYPGTGGPDDVYLVDGIGARRFEINEEKCRGAQEDWDRAAAAARRDLIERHIRRFESCPTVEAARRRLVTMSDSVEDPPVAPALVTNRPIDPCDRYAASDTDRARPPEVPGVMFGKIEPDGAIAACKDSVAKNPRVVRYLFNLGRALMAQANSLNPVSQKTERTETYRQARLTYDDAQQRGYVAAVYNLGVMYDLGLGVAVDQDRANDLFKRAAQQGFPLAMYSLARRYRSGENDIPRDDAQAYEWFAKASESGLTEATVEVGEALWYGNGVAGGRNPRRAMDALQRAAEAGSNRAKLLMGVHYFLGSNSGDDDPNGITQDNALALLWLGRAAENNDPGAQYFLALIMEGGWGLPAPQPEIAERYWRFAAYGGSENAQVEFADRLKFGRVLAKPENGTQEGIRLWERAYSQGSARAALELARLYRKGADNVEKDPILAMQYAYQAIALATRANPLTEDGNPFYEIAAGILLAEMARNNEAMDATGRPLLNKDEIDRLEKFYGRVDPVTKEVKVRRLQTRLTCFRYRSGKDEYARQTPRASYFWVWDWGRVESPTEPQFRALEYQTGCSDNKDLRETLSASFQLSQKSKVPFADLIDQQIKVAATANEQTTKRRRR